MPLPLLNIEIRITGSRSGKGGTFPLTKGSPSAEAGKATEMVVMLVVACLVGAALGSNSICRFDY